MQRELARLLDCDDMGYSFDHRAQRTITYLVCNVTNVINSFSFTVDLSALIWRLTGLAVMRFACWARTVDSLIVPILPRYCRDRDRHRKLIDADRYRRDWSMHAHVILLSWSHGVTDRRRVSARSSAAPRLLRSTQRTRANALHLCTSIIWSFVLDFPASEKILKISSSHAVNIQSRN